MLPERSTAMSRSRPLTGSAIASPTNCGRAAAIAVRVQTVASNSRRAEGRVDLRPPCARTANALPAGTFSAAPVSSGWAGKKRRTSQGSGSNASIHHQASAHMTPSVLLLALALRVDPIDRERTELDDVAALRPRRWCIRRAGERTPRARRERVALPAAVEKLEASLASESRR